MNDNEEFEKISVLESDIEAQFIESILNEQEIPHRMQSFHDTAYDGLFQVQKGWGVIYAPPSYKQEIIEIINDARTQDQDQDQDI